MSQKVFERALAFCLKNIENGKWKKSDKLPSILNLSKQVCVGCTTMRKVLLKLQLKKAKDKTSKYKNCTKCKKLKNIEEDFYKIKKSKYYLSECKECFKKRAKKDRKKRGLEHDAKVKRVWAEKQGGKEYYKKISREFYRNNTELVKKRALEYYHKTKKHCEICKKIRPKCFFKEDSTICKNCIKIKNGKSND